ncbi:SpoIIIAH-like family protein [Ammoniphilus resinae]|uniref:Stage III sporulation protein AH n=1 Tax=Ammoniphilus resinae TaxID=861532 RepID=A0ABS4GWD9_9BACL|nr:SpoIIIAH-like family protein [Ammoniphilus resinae]MBP1934180.1 stage III sporulation protein AH [Ammoniphilus resinae]
MVLKKQTVWLLSMLTIMVVLSAYYLLQGPVEQVPVATEQLNQKVDPTQEDVQVDSQQIMPQTMEDLVAPEASSEDYFLAMKMNRDAHNSLKMEEYMTVMTNGDASAEAITEAKDGYEELTTMQETETNVENLIKAMGFNEAVVIAKDDKVNVIVQADKLDRTKAVEIMTLISKHLDVPGKNVVVSYKQ